MDHPRVCGENIITAIAEAAPTGSPPRMRGKRASRYCAADSTRITPAYAGKTYLLLLAVKRERDHPRVCGENRVPFSEIDIQIGSPPRMRGKPRTYRRHSAHIGITPAYAGKTCFSDRERIKPEDHPRVCGENARTRRSTAVKIGSPPQVRGKPCNLIAVQLLREDHPRRCGENILGFGGFRLDIGSPPQVRGKRLFSSLVTDILRITPAGAGKTCL